MRRTLRVVSRRCAAFLADRGTLAAAPRSTSNWSSCKSNDFDLFGAWKQALSVALAQKNKQFTAAFMFYSLEKSCLKPKYCEAAYYAGTLCNNKSSFWNLDFVETTSLLFRAVYLIVIFSPALFFSGLAEYCRGRLRHLWLRLLLITLENAGPAFIKWGQWAATRPDVFPEDVCSQLSKLHNKAPQHSFKETRRIVESAFGCALEDLFLDFSEQPEASGSIAQVHQATLKRVRGNEEQRVAVKVRHPSVLTDIQRDFRIIKSLAWVSTLIPGLKHLQLDKNAHHFATFMTQQVDLSLEAVHLTRFLYNFRKVQDVVFPEPKYPFVHPAVLVESFEDGETIANITSANNSSRLHTRLAELGTQTLLKMILEDNFVHGDLHPGNVLVRSNGSSPQLVLVDAGMTAELNKKSRSTLFELFKGVAERDGFRVAECTLAFSENQACADPEKFKLDVEAKFRNYLADSGSAQSTGECMTQLFEEIRKHGVNIDGDVCTVMVTTMVLEGWQRKLDPNFDILDVLGSLLNKLRQANSLEYVMLGIAAP